MALQRRVSSTSSGTTANNCLDVCELSLRYPTTFEFLSLRKWPDGAVRQTGTITMMVDQNTFKASMHDRDSSVSTFVSARTFTGLLEAMEKALLDESTEWRDKTPYPPNRRGRGT